MVRAPFPKKYGFNLETMEYLRDNYRERLPKLPDGSPEKAEMLEFQDFVERQISMFRAREQASRDDD